MTNSEQGGIIFADKQLGKKFGKHCRDWGLSPSSEQDREKLKKIVSGIKEHCDIVRIGAFNGQLEECLFYIKGDDVVITKQNNEFITVLRGGISDAWVKKSRRK